MEFIKIKSKFFIIKMCYTIQTSIGAFLTGVISSILLITLGDKEFKNENIIVGTLFLFVSFMELFDVMMYMDPNCDKGWNRLAGYLGPLFNAFQPTILYIFFMIMTQDPKHRYHSYRPLVSVVNVIYIGYILTIYSKYVQKDQLCTTYENGRLRWTWYNNGFGNTFDILYIGILLFNVLFFLGSTYSVIVVTLVSLFLFISILNYRYHIGEFWCFFVNSIPLILLILQKTNLLKK
jgi:hypothetical protein